MRTVERNTKPRTGTMIKFNKFNVTNGTTKARVHYSLDGHTSGKPCVTIYAKDYDRALGDIFDAYVNRTDTNTDYFDKGNVKFFEGDKFYTEARVRAEANNRG